MAGKIQLTWGEFDPLSPENRLIAKSLEEWEGTPYHLFGQAKGAGGGVDCVRFLTGVADDVEGVPRRKLPRTMADAAMHAPQLARGVMRELIRMYDLEVVEDGVLQPGDFLVAAPIGGGPGHGIFVGLGHLWHSTEAGGVVRTGLHLDQMDIVRHLRRK